MEDQGDAEDKGDLGDVASLESGSGTNESTSSGIGMSERESDLNNSLSAQTTMKSLKRNSQVFKMASSSQTNLSRVNDGDGVSNRRRFSD